MSNKTSEDRIEIIDSFRALSIIGVMLYHFFSAYVNFSINGKPYYPYENKYDFFFWGKYGVEFFFIISGFVIFYTLTNTPNLITFAKRRFTRLFPSILVSTLIIYVFLLFFDVHDVIPEGHKLRNFIPSLTFVKPSIFSEISRIIASKTQFEYINGSYWSLWPEIEFYFIAGTLFFYNKKKYTRNLFIVTISLMIVQNFLLGNQELYRSSSDWIRIVLLYSSTLSQHFDIANYIFYFSIGSLSFSLFCSWKNRKKVELELLLYIMFLVLIQTITVQTNMLIIVNLVMVLLFMAFIYFPKTISYIKNPFLSKIGLSSYFLYLIHEPIGILIINSFGGKTSNLAFILPLLLIFALISISIYYYDNIEKRLTNLCRQFLIKA